MIPEKAKQFVEQTGANKNQSLYYQAILFIYAVLFISYGEMFSRTRQKRLGRGLFNLLIYMDRVFGFVYKPESIRRQLSDGDAGRDIN